jgi:MSHA biogenesis protein MshJ
VSILMCCFALVDTLWLSPAQTVHRQLMQRLDRQNGELQRLRDSVRASAQPKDADQAARAELQTTQTQLDQVNQAVRERLPGATRSTPLAQALVQLLRRHEGLTLVRTAALPPDSAGPGNSNGTGSLPKGLTRQGVTLTVAGAYADLMRYVASLESSMPYVRWGAMTLSSDKGRPELTLQLFLLGETTP